MNKLALAASIILVAIPTIARADDFLPVGIYDCTIQPEGTMKMLPIGVLKVTAEGFSGPAAGDAETEIYVYLLNPDNKVNWPIEFAKNVEGGAEVIDATWYPFLAVVQTNIGMTDGATASVACGQRPV